MRRDRTPIEVHMYAINSDFSNLVMQTISQWVQNAQDGAQQQADPLPDPSNVGEENPEISDTDTEDEGPSSSKRPRGGPSTYCSPKDTCGPNALCGPLHLSKTSGFILGIASSLVQNIGNCISDPFAVVSARRLGKRADDWSRYGTPANPHLGQALALPICNADMYGRPKRADCANAAEAMEKDGVIDNQERWRRPTSYFGSATGSQEGFDGHWGHLQVPRTYQCGMSSIRIGEILPILTCLFDYQVHALSASTSVTIPSPTTSTTSRPSYR